MADKQVPVHRILVVEDDTDQRRLVSGVLRGEGHQVEEAATVEEALAALTASPLDLVVSDWKLPDRDGMQLLKEIRERYPEVAFIMVTAYGTISHAVDAVRVGADDYLAKPFERQALLLAIERTLRSRRLADENRRLTEALDQRDRLVELIGKAPSMQKLFRRVEKVAGTEAMVLITGESGTGKELAARALHILSRRAAGPFVPVNCAAIPEGLIEAEFFGVEKGAYTGADRSREGSFEAAREGTLFLDEVGEMPLHVQPKLLRALQGGKVSRVGSAEEVAIDVRIVASSNPWSPSPCRRCARGGRTSACSSSTSWTPRSGVTGSSARASRRGWSSASWITPGPAMSASWRTWWSVSSCWRRTRPCGSRTCPTTWPVASHSMPASSFRLPASPGTPTSGAVSGRRWTWPVATAPGRPGSWTCPTRRSSTGSTSTA